MASTGTGSRGISPVFQLNGAFAIPNRINMESTIKVTNLFSKKNFMILFNISFDFDKQSINYKLRQINDVTIHFNNKLKP